MSTPNVLTAPPADSCSASTAGRMALSPAASSAISTASPSMRIRSA